MINELKLLRGIKQYDFTNDEYHIHMKEVEPGILGIVLSYNQYGGTYKEVTRFIQMKKDISLYVQRGKVLIEGIYIWGSNYKVKHIMETIVRVIEEHIL